MLTGRNPIPVNIKKAENKNYIQIVKIIIRSNC